MPETHFAERLTEHMQRKQSQVVVGLDPRLDKLPTPLRVSPEADSGECSDAVLAFNRGVIDAVAESAVAVKPQIAFYEAFGSAGVAAYAQTLAHARSRGLLVIGDVKRNDIASTAAAYAAGHLGEGGGRSDLVADAITINPYLGEDGVRPFLEAARAAGRGLFALVKTSNPSSADLQDVLCEGRHVYEVVAELVEEWGAADRGACGYSLLGAVVGATFPQELARLRRAMPHTPLLVPGFGAQGGGLEDVLAAFDAEGQGAVINSSRGIIFAWQREPYAERFGEARWKDAVRQAAEDMRAALWTATH